MAADQEMLTPPKQETNFTGSLPLWKRWILCCALLIVESYITFEEIYFISTLQRYEVPYVLLTLPGVITGAVGIFAVPLIGWASDRLKQGKRIFASYAIVVLFCGMIAIIVVTGIDVYQPVTQPPLSANYTAGIQETALAINTSGLANKEADFNKSASATINSAPALDNSSSALANSTSALANSTSALANSTPVLPNSTSALANSEPALATSASKTSSEPRRTKQRSLSFLAVLAMVSFVLGDHGYDISSSSFRAYVLSITHPSQHPSVLVTATMMSAIGGCVTSLIGYVDFAAWFPQYDGYVLDTGDAQCLVHSVIFTVILIVLSVLNLCAPPRWFRVDTDKHTDTDTQTTDAQGLNTGKKQQHSTARSPNAKSNSQPNALQKLLSNTRARIKNYTQLQSQTDNKAKSSEKYSRLRDEQPVLLSCDNDGFLVDEKRENVNRDEEDIIFDKKATKKAKKTDKPSSSPSPQELKSTPPQEKLSGVDGTSHASTTHDSATIKTTEDGQKPQSRDLVSDLAKSGNPFEEDDEEEKEELRKLSKKSDHDNNKDGNTDGSKSRKTENQNTLGSKDQKLENQNTVGSEDGKPESQNTNGSKSGKPENKNVLGSKNGKPENKNVLGSKNGKPENKNVLGSKNGKPENKNVLESKNGKPENPNSAGNKDRKLEDQIFSIDSEDDNDSQTGSVETTAVDSYQEAARSSLTERLGITRKDSRTCLVHQPSTPASRLEKFKTWLQRKKRVFSLLGVVFCSIIAMASYFFYVTNFIAEIIFQGDPYASAGSDDYDRYVSGIRMGSLSMLAMYVVFVVYNLLHDKILNKIGMKAEFLLASVFVTVMTLTLTLTKSLVVVFINVIPLAIFRSAVFTTPFILANKFAQQDQKEQAALKSKHQKPNQSKSSKESHSQSESTSLKTDQSEEEFRADDQPKTGEAIASVAAMIPLTYFLVCVFTGPLIALTNSTAAPMYVATGFFALSFFATFLVYFE